MHYFLCRLSTWHRSRAPLLLILLQSIVCLCVWLVLVLTLFSVACAPSPVCTSQPTTIHHVASNLFRGKRVVLCTIDQIHIANSIENAKGMRKFASTRWSGARERETETNRDRNFSQYIARLKIRKQNKRKYRNQINCQREKIASASEWANEQRHWRCEMQQLHMSKRCSKLNYEHSTVNQLKCKQFPIETPLDDSVSEWMKARDRACSAIVIRLLLWPWPQYRLYQIISQKANIYYIDKKINLKQTCNMELAVDELDFGFFGVWESKWKWIEHIDMCRLPPTTSTTTTMMMMTTATKEHRRCFSNLHHTSTRRRSIDGFAIADVDKFRITSLRFRTDSIYCILSIIVNMHHTLNANEFCKIIPI